MPIRSAKRRRATNVDTGRGRDPATARRRSRQERPLHRCICQQRNAASPHQERVRSVPCHQTKRARECIALRGRQSIDGRHEGQDEVMEGRKAETPSRTRRQPPGRPACRRRKRSRSTRAVLPIPGSPRTPSARSPRAFPRRRRCPEADRALPSHAVLDSAARLTRGARHCRGDGRQSDCRGRFDAHTARLHQPTLVRNRDKLRTVVGVQLTSSGRCGPHGGGGDNEAAGDRVVAQAERHQRQDLALAESQLLDLGGGSGIAVRTGKEVFDQAASGSG